jgi:hypothetical protein
MAYIVNNRVGTVVATIADGTIDTTSSSLTLLGKGFNNYGEIVAEDWIHIIENFASTTAPSNAILGQLWFDISSDTLKTNKSNTFGVPDWEEVTQTIVNAAEPTTISHDYGIGALWFDTVNNLLNISIDGIAWEVIKPIKTATGGEPAVIGTETGSLFYDQDTKELKVLNPDLHGTAVAGWDIIGPARYKGSIPPLAPRIDGDEWWDSDNKQLYMYDQGAGSYRLIGPSTPSAGSPSAIGLGFETGSFTIEIDGNSLVAMVVDDEILGLWSRIDFTPTVPIRELVASGTGTVAPGVPSSVVGPGRQWHFHNVAEVSPITDIERGLNLSTIVGGDTEPTVLHGTATQAQYT